MLTEIFRKYGYDDPLEELRKELLERLPTLTAADLREYDRMIEAWNRRPLALILHEVFAEQDRRWGRTPEKSEAQVRYEMFPPDPEPEFRCKGGINDGFGTNLLRFLASEPFAVGHREAVETLRQHGLNVPPIPEPEFRCKGGINDGFGTNLLRFLASEPFAVGHREAVETLRQQGLKLTP